MQPSITEHRSIGQGNISSANFTDSNNDSTTNVTSDPVSRSPSYSARLAVIDRLAEKARSVDNYIRNGRFGLSPPSSLEKKRRAIATLLDDTRQDDEDSLANLSENPTYSRVLVPDSGIAALRPDFGILPNASPPSDVDYLLEVPSDIWIFDDGNATGQWEKRDVHVPSESGKSGRKGVEKMLDDMKLFGILGVALMKETSHNVILIVVLAG